MNGWVAAVLSLLVVVNPIGVSRAVGWQDRTVSSWRREVSTIVGAAALALVTLGLVTAPLLDLADLTTPTFRLAASVVIGFTGAVWMIAPTSPVKSLDDHTSAPVTLGLTMLLTPGPVFAAMAANGDGGVAAGVVSVIIAMGATLALLVAKRLPEPVAVWATRFIGALTIVVAVGVGINAARTV